MRQLVLLQLGVFIILSLLATTAKAQNWMVLDSLSSVYTTQKEFQQAKVYIQRAIVEYGSEGNKEDAAYIKLLLKAGNICAKIPDFQGAYENFQIATTLTKPLQGERRILYLESLYQLAIAVDNLGKPKDALLLKKESYELGKEILDKTDTRYNVLASNLAFSYYRLGDYERSILLMEEVLSLMDDDDPNYLIFLQNVVSLQIKLGKSNKALAYIQEVVDHARKLDKDSKTYGELLLYIGEAYEQMGLYEKAVPLLDSARIILELHQNDSPVLYTKVLQRLTSLHRLLGNYLVAIELGERCVRLSRQLFGSKHIAYANNLHTLAMVYVELEEYEKALESLQTVLEIYRKELGANSLEYANTLNSLAVYHQKKKAYKKSQNLLQESLNVFETILGKQSFQFGLKQLNLASIYQLMGAYDKSEFQFHQGLKNLKRNLGEKHSEYLHYSQNLAHLYHQQNKYLKADSIYGHSLTAIGDVINRVFPVLNEQERTAFLAKEEKRFNNLLSHVEEAREFVSSSSTLAYDYLLLRKELLLFHSKATRESIISHGDTSLQRVYINWLSLNRRLNQVLNLESIERDSLNELSASLQSQLSIRSANFRQLQKKHSYQEVRGALEKTEAAIEFIRFTYRDEKQANRAVVKYVALVARSDYDSPKYVPICEESSLEGILSTLATDKPLRLKIQEIYKSRILYQLIWEPLDSLLDGIEHVYYSPAGLLHQLNMGAITVDEGRNLLEKYEIQQVSSTRNLLWKVGLSETVKPAYGILYGGITYDTDTLVLLDKTSKLYPSSRNFTLIPRNSNKVSPWQNLDTTLVELQTLEQLFKSQSLYTMTYKQHEASEESFKAMGIAYPAPSILHLATHAYFFSKPLIKRKMAPLDIGSPIFRFSENPLYRSGLLLAGANQAWMTGRTLEGSEDGILTAAEISNMNLGSTQLVTLSACNTALGDVNSLEGVYGLQRALKMAGADHLLLTLWSIRDSHHTVEFMESFYTNWLSEELPIREAFRETQLAMKAKYDDPFFWAPFILIQ